MIQSEAIVENNLIQQLTDFRYELASIHDGDALLA